jgi:hypothetical protein
MDNVVTEKDLDVFTYAYNGLISPLIFCFNNATNYQCYVFAWPHTFSNRRTIARCYLLVPVSAQCKV